MSSTLSPKSALFVTAEGTGGIEFVVGIRPNHAGTQFVHDLENLAAFVGPNAGAQTVRRVIGAFDRFIRRAESHDAQDRPEDFFLRDAV